jgi:hypothetical protein
MVLGCSTASIFGIFVEQRKSLLLFREQKIDGGGWHNRLSQELSGHFCVGTIAVKLRRYSSKYNYYPVFLAGTMPFLLSS